MGLSEVFGEGVGAIFEGRVSNAVIVQNPVETQHFIVFVELSSSSSSLKGWERPFSRVNETTWKESPRSGAMGAFNPLPPVCASRAKLQCRPQHDSN